MKSKSTVLTYIKPSDLQQSIIIIFLVISIFILDTLLPLGVAGGVPYIIVVLATYWHSNSKSVIYVAITCSLLVLIGFYLSPKGGELWKVIFNRGIAIFVILITAVLILKMKKYLNLGNTARIEAESANKAKSQFLSSMSHELRTPMNVIMGYAQLIELDAIDSSSKQNINEIVKASNHLLELINQVLDLAAIESGKVSLFIDNYSVNELIVDCLITIMPIADNQNIKIDNQINPLLLHMIKVDKTRFRQIIINLLSNAIKYNKKNGTVIIDCLTIDENTLCVSVSDTGNGLTSEQKSRIFKPFERAGAESSHIGGSGLGLVISKDLIEQMNGSIGFESEVGKGSRFWLEIPIS